MRKQILIRLLCLLCLVGVCLVGAAYAQNTATLTAQEALFPAVANNRGTVNWSQLFAATGIDRTNEPVTVGIPLPNAWQVLESDTSRAVSFTGTNGIWQTKCEAHWTSGYCKWLLIDAQLPSVTHDSTNTTFTLSTSGTGPTSGQAALAVDSNPGAPNTGTITVTTGTGTAFTIRKASFNLFDIVTVGGTPLVATNTSDGLVVSGPVYPATTCSSPATDCTTEYKSSLDSASTAVLERNGPALAIVKADGALKDSGAHAYLRYTVRLTFYAGKSYVSARVILRNADDATGAGSFASAFKGMASWEARVKLVSLSSPVAKFSTASSSVSHNMQAGEDAYLYQAYSTAFYDGDGESNNWKNPPITRTSLGSGANGDYIWAQNGWLANYGTSGSYTLIPGGSGPITDHNHDWADIADSAGKGVLMGAYYSTAYWPKSFGYFGGGTEARIGMFPNQGLYTGTCAASPCRIPWYQPWPQYKIDDVYFNFHASAIAAPDAEFMKWQQRLLARATVDHYNSTGAFAYSLISSADMDTYTTDLVNNANPAGYLGGWLASKHSIDFMPGVFFIWPWSQGSQGNQTDFREQYLKQFWQHGFTGRYLWAENFNRYLLEEAFPRADFAGGWRSHAFTDVDLRSNPSKVSSANNNLSNGGLAYGDRDNYWIDAGNGDIHGHTYGIFDWYLATGDQTYLDFIRQAQVDAYLNTASTLYAPPFTSSGVTIPRQWGIRAIHAARMVEFFDSIGDTATANLAKTFGDNLAALVTGDVQLSGTGANTHGTDTLMGYALPIYGTSRTRGEVLLDWGGNYTGITAGHTNYQTECNAYEDGNLGGTYATTSNVPYQTSMMVQGVKELAWIRGPSWANYKLLRDLAYGWAKSS
ncbi:MAG TPA: hypothetical protein VJ756_06080, partial [Terriglobales bacterium]|nr:hypothetical protein [Terriglobales bacterium]